MEIFASDYFGRLTERARSTPRLRQHQNIHRSYDEPCQRLFNAIEPGSYIRPHRHASDPRDELLIAVRGLMALVTFSNNGEIAGTIRLATEKFGAETCSAVEVPSNVWHMVVALKPGSVLLEIKAGPFDPLQPKDMAPWAPPEGSVEAFHYLSSIEAKIGNFR